MSFAKCTCIDDTNRPPQIPEDRWINRGDEYRILGLYRHVKQGYIQGVTLMEKPLDETCRPYKTFAIRRFGFKKEDIPTLIQLAKDCNELREMEEAELLELFKEQEVEELAEIENNH